MKKATRQPGNQATRGKSKGPKAPLRLEWVAAGTLQGNPKNWRRHPREQMAALRHTLDKNGWAGALLYNERTKHLIDGHARLELVDPKQIVPVLIGRWGPAQEAELLATLDPVGAMATADSAALRILLDEVELQTPELEALDAQLRQLLDESPTAVETETTETATPVQETPRVCPKCGYRWIAK
ncbi:MAG: hypothetical protein KAY37_00885 [Phycisphaerae bacterium]|nr:hypothetical protein [Phycisphaerae bacterium]